MNNFQTANRIINQLANVKKSNKRNTMKTTTINMEQLIKYNEFITTFISYYAGFYSSDEYNELVKTIYSINPLDPMQGTFDRYNYCLEISNFDKTTDRINQLVGVTKPLNKNTMKTTKLQQYAIAYTLGVSVSDIKSTEIDIENDIIIVHYNVRYYNSPKMVKRVLSYMDIYDTVMAHGRSLLNI